MNNMKCPFCGKQMYHPIGKATWSCQNWDCLKSEGMIGNHVLWQELIRTRKALETLQEFITKLYLNGNITDEQLKRYKKMLTTALEQKD